MEYEKAIQEIIRFKETFDIIRIEQNKTIPEKLKGVLGELYVLNKLREIGFSDIEHNKPASNYDIFLKNSKTKIEVRTSFPKNEGIYPVKQYPTLFYGWTALREKEIEPKYDFLVCVALEKETFRNPRFYIFDIADVKKIDEVRLSRFKNVKKKIHLFVDEKSYQNAVSTKPDLITNFERYINENSDDFHNRWDKIKME